MCLIVGGSDAKTLDDTQICLCKYECEYVVCMMMSQVRKRE